MFASRLPFHHFTLLIGNSLIDFTSDWNFPTVPGEEFSLVMARRTHDHLALCSWPFGGSCRRWASCLTARPELSQHRVRAALQTPGNPLPQGPLLTINKHLDVFHPSSTQRHSRRPNIFSFCFASERAERSRRGREARRVKERGTVFISGLQ